VNTGNIDRIVDEIRLDLEGKTINKDLSVQLMMEVNEFILSKGVLNSAFVNGNTIHNTYLIIKHRSCNRINNVFRIFVNNENGNITVHSEYKFKVDCNDIHLIDTIYTHIIEVVTP